MAQPVKLPLDTLNPQQREAVETLEGPVLLLAGAGSGKTRVITFRVGHLIEKGIEPQNILAVSFTNKAATEMRERVAHLMGRQIADRVHLSTFHSLGADILKKHIEKIGYKKKFTILDQGDQLSLVKEVMKELNLDPKVVDPAALLFLISRAKMALADPRSLPEFKYHPMMPFAQKAHRNYQAALRGLNAVDFDDLICLPVQLFREREDVRKKYSELFKYVMVDEYQDTNATQLMFLEAIVRDHHNICVVGDDDQSIYAFRGAVSGNILLIEKKFPGTRVIKLEQNYRSTNTILGAANSLISHNRMRKEKTLWSANGAGEPITVIHAKDEREEAEYVAAEIDALKFQHDLNYSDFAILFRVNPQARLFEEAFRMYRIPYKLVGGQEFFDRKEVKDFIAYLKSCLNPDDEVNLRRIVNVPPRGLGPVTVDRISQYAHTQKITFFRALEAVAAGEVEIENVTHGPRENLTGLVELLKRFHGRFDTNIQLKETARELLHDLHFIDYIRSSENSAKIASKRIDNVEEVLSSIAAFETRSGGTLDGFLTRITLDQSNTGSQKEEKDAVQCMTIHASKGLEFPVVFLVGMEEGYLPHDRSITERGGIDEERRLAYVGITRAKQHLYMTLATTRTRFGRKDDREPSRYLKEVPTEMLTSNTADASSPLADKREEQNKKYLDALRATIFKDPE
jgi:superfamily I DNA/RNA helicase